MARRIAILGAGKIGEALLSGLLSSGWRTPGEIVVTARREERIAELTERYGVTATLANAEAVAGSELVVIENAGHFNYAEQPERFFAAVRSWLG